MIAPTTIAGVAAAPKPAPDPAARPEREQLAAASKAFEAIFVRQMLSAARKTDFGDPLLGGQALDTFRQMQDDRFADIAAESGAFGLAKIIEAQLSMHLPPSRLREGSGEGLSALPTHHPAENTRAFPRPLPQAGGESVGSGPSGRGF